MSFRVVVADSVDISALTAIAGDPRFEIVVANGPALRPALREAAALIVRSETKVGEDLLQEGPDLKVVARAGVGVDNIDVEAATRRNIAVFNAPNANTLAAAELTVALILAAVRKIAAADRALREGRWDRAAFKGVELRGRTLGLVGAGRIGKEVAVRCQAFGMTVLACDPYLDQCEGVELCSMERVLTESDVISVHVPLNEETRHLVDADRLAMMRRGSYLVNASRGGVVDEAALVDALESGQLAGAALDVYESEPPSPSSPLLQAPNLVLTPHLGASTAEAQVRVASEVAEAIRRALVDGDATGAVNAPRPG